MPGPPPKPPGRRQRRNTAAVGPIEPTRPGRPTSATTPPAAAEWLVATRDSWTALWSAPLARATYDLASDLSGVRRLFAMRDDRERYSRAARKHPLVEGSKDQPVANPLFAEIRALDARIIALEDRYGLNPSARFRLGIALGAAKKSLDDLTKGISDGQDGGDEEDPRLGSAIDTRSRQT